MKRLTSMTFTAILSVLAGCVSFDNDAFSKAIHEAVDEAIVPVITSAIADTKLLISACGEFYVSRSSWPTSKIELETFLSEIGSTTSLAGFKDMNFEVMDDESLKLSYKKELFDSEVSYTLKLRGGDLELIKKALEDGNEWPSELLKHEAHQVGAHNSGGCAHTRETSALCRN